MADMSSRAGVIEPHEEIDGGGCDINGVETNIEEDTYGISVTRIRIFNEQGAEAMGKPIGNYITLQSRALTNGDVITQSKIIKRLAREIGKFRFLRRYTSVLVVGLGNQSVTPDALGPKVCSKILVTKHLQSSAQAVLKERIRDVSAISPGVTGATGIESFEIVKGVTDRTKPDAVIIVDSLAAREISRINTTVQMTDTGVTPGAGTGNKRMILDKETLGVPVLSIGAPTIIDAVTLVNDVMTKIFDNIYVKRMNGISSPKMPVGLNSFRES